MADQKISQLTATTATGTDNIVIQRGSNNYKSLISSLPGGGGAVSSVFGRTGAVVAAEGDYDLNKLGDVGSTVATAANNILAANGNVYIGQSADDISVVDKTTAQTLTNKTLTNPAITNPSGIDMIRSITIDSPTSSEDRTIFFTPKALTITEMRAVLIGSSTPSVTWTIRHHATDRSNAGNEVVTGGTTTTSTTSGSDVTVFNDATIPANSFVWLETTAKSGTVNELHVSIVFDYD